MTHKANALAGCQWYASSYGWNLLRGNAMVEGTSDVKYFSLASDLYYKSTGMKLLGCDFSLFAAGQGDDGGTYGISEKFPTLFNLSNLDIDSESRQKHRVIALVDDDKMGRAAVNGITKGHRKIIEYQSIFRLRRVMPLRAGSTQKLLEKTREANTEFGDLECVIEDLLAPDLCSVFFSDQKLDISRSFQVRGTGKHYSLTVAQKSKLLRFAYEYATLTDVGSLIGVLKALRSYVGLPEDGIKSL